jgi:hypothetical protein
MIPPTNPRGAPNMFEKFSRSWALAKASASVLQSDKELLLFPVISTVAMLLVIATFAVPIFALDLFANGEPDVFAIILGFLFYVTQYFVIFFFNTALVGAAMIRLEGGDPTVKDGLNIAMAKIVPILGYAAIAATVGMILNALKERAGFLGDIVINLVGAAWTVATAMVVPVLVAQDVGPVDAIKESVMLLKKNWGENIIGNSGIGLAFGLVMFATIILGIVLAVIGASISPWLGLGVAVVAVIAVLLLAVIQAALSGIYSAALYRFAVDGQAPAGFEGGALQMAFRPKG